MNNNPNNHIEVKAVNSKKLLNTFIKVPWEIYKDDPYWVPPLLVERKTALSSQHPYFQHAKWQAWIAFKDGNPVGRISAQIDELHQQQYQNRTGFFGLIEAIDDPEVFSLLFETAENWLRDAGMQHIAGPFSLSINQEIGVLTDGFDSPPYVMTVHSAPYYGEQIERCGYDVAQELLAYYLDAHTLRIPRIMRALIKRSSSRVNVRNLDRKNLDSEFEVIRGIFNDAWQNNWNFVPFTKEEFRAMAKDLLLILPDDFIQIAEIDGESAAFIVLLPDLNEAIADLNGRLAPFGWAKLYSRLKLNLPKRARVPLMGVRQRYQNTIFGPAMAYIVIEEVINAGIARGLESVEMSWILDSNKGTKNIIESVGGEISKRYHMYEKKLD